MPFVNVDGHECVVHFYFEGWGGSVTELTGGARPFVLSEFNTDEDYFKPVRPQEATIEIIAKAGVISIDDFLADNDSDILVSFDFGDFTNYWYGYLYQEDMQETWVDTIHILTLRASEGIGSLKNVPLNDAGQYLSGRYTPLQLIQYATVDTALPWTEYNVISNLFHTSMFDSDTDTGLDQCNIDPRTFENQPTVFEDSYSVLEKINKAWNQTLFQWMGKWWIYRAEEAFLNPTLELHGFEATPLSFPTRTLFQKRFDISVGVDETVRPIAPEMIRFLKKPSKISKVTYNWEDFAEIVCNETFQRGDVLTESSTEVTYEVDNWTHLQGSNIGTTNTPGLSFIRIEEYDNGKLQDSYVQFSSGATDEFIRSCPVYVSANDYISISFQHRYNNPTSTAAGIATAFVLLIGNGNYYTLDDDGSWNVSNSTFTTNVKNLEASYVDGEWQTYELTSTNKESDPVPEDGFLYILLYKTSGTGFNGEKEFKDLKVNIVPQIQKIRNRQINGDYDQYTIERDVINNFDDEIFLDDADSKNHKGAIFEADGVTLTGDQWYRRRYDTERFTFKRHNALAHWFMNRNYKSKLDCNLRGLIWSDNGVDKPIGLINTVNFVDDAPTKTFAILNLKEIDFMAGTWSATLLEIYDTDIPDDVPGETDVHSFGYNYENQS